MGLVYNWYNCNSDSCEGLSCNNNICFKQDNWNFNYTTNRLWSYEKFRFGYFEIRCQIIKPTAPKTNKGIGPNFWLWSKKDEISISELDVFEFNGQNSTFCPNIHYRLNDSAPYYHWSPGLNIYVNFNTAHTFAAHWLPQKLNILLDNSLVASTTVNTANLQAMPMIVDVNVPASNYCQFIDATTQFPHNYDVYWVKVYQLKNRCTLDNQICSLASALYGQFRNIQIGGDGCSISVSSGQNIHLVATNSITIDKNVTIGLGATFVAETFPEVVSEHDIPLKSANIPSPPPAGFYNRHY